MNDGAVEKAVVQYCAAWGEADKGKREAMLRAVLREDVEYVDPTVHAAGIEELSRHIETVIERYPDSTIVVTSMVDHHHALLRFAWKKVLRDGTSLPEGVDFCELSADGKLSRIVGFFGSLRTRG